MRIGFVVERPTQFEAPFFKFVARDSSHRLHVFFTREDAAAPNFDPELGRSVSWGFDLLEGYAHEALPARGLAARLGGFDLVIVNGYTQRPYLRAALAARRAGVRTGLRIDSVLARPGAAPLSKRALFQLALLRLFDLFFATGSLTREYLAACGVPEARVGTFPYAVDVDHFREHARLSPVARAARRAAWGVPEAARIVLSVAKLSPREAPWDLLRAAALRRDAGIVWLIAGDGPLRRELARFADEHALANVHFLGYVPYPELPALYGAADLFVHPAREERWGVSVAEAMAAGLPVVASSRVGAARDLVMPAGNGFTYAVGDEHALARCIQDALALPLGAVQRANAAALSRCDYVSAWRGLVDAALRAGSQRLHGDA